MNTRITAIALIAVAFSACGDFEIVDPNGPSIDALEKAPTASALSLATQGLFIQARATVNTYAGFAGIYGRETYNLDPSEVRNLLSYIVGPLEPGGFGIDMGWTNEYRLMRQGNIILAGLEAVGEGMSEPNRHGIRGVVKTLQANALLNVIRVRDDIGAAIDVDRDRSGEPAPIVDKAAVYARITQLLDEARTHLAAAGTTLPFTVPSGFASYNTPANFIKFNRAIHARANLYQGKYADVLTSIGLSFISTAAANLQAGAYHTFSTTAGDASNPAYDPTARAWAAHPSFLVDAQRRADGSVDLRAQKKVAVISPPRILQGVSTNLRGTVYNSANDPMPIIKNEDLVLMRAEAQWFTGAKAAAIADLDVVRVNSGGLPASTLTTGSSDADFVTALLYERRYSLFWEYGHRWVDMRRFNRLAQLPKAVPDRDRIFPYVPLPVDECTPRNPQPAGCRQVNGI
ncbi:MAG TPA: RagB/SusD family nutrient uptake outer membrane protein [Longimicrobiales bacterium]|nr:RagB/SusD family nutrient uptake outer membrane protein [Longimicrobiales bacterium]